MDRNWDPNGIDGPRTDDDPQVAPTYWLVGGWPTPLKIWVRQWLEDYPIYEIENKINVPNHQPVLAGTSSTPKHQPTTLMSFPPSRELKKRGCPSILSEHNSFYCSDWLNFLELKFIKIPMFSLKSDGYSSSSL